MRIITCEEHYGSSELTEETRKLVDPSLTERRLNPELGDLYEQFCRGEAGLYDMKQRLDFMDKNGVDMQILSYSNSLFTEIPVAEQVEIYARANDKLAAVCEEYPGRFAAFATLPLSNIDASVRELKRCVEELGFKGVMLDSGFNGMFYDDLRLLPVFNELERLDVPLHLHPSFVDERVVKQYYKGDSLEQLTTLFLSSAAFGWHLDAGMQLLRMIVSGLFDACPRLKVISGHWGEVVIYYIDRMNDLLAPGRVNLERTIAEYYRDNIYAAPSGILSNDMMDFCIKKVGIDHVLFSLDYPYVPLEGADKWLVENPNLQEEDKEKIAHVNAEKLFRL